jgi:hypothetical protein
MSDQAASVRIAAAGFHMHLVKPVEPVKLLNHRAQFSCTAS